MAFELNQETFLTLSQTWYRQEWTQSTGLRPSRDMRCIQIANLLREQGMENIPYVEAQLVLVGSMLSVPIHERRERVVGYFSAFAKGIVVYYQDPPRGGGETVDGLVRRGSADCPYEVDSFLLPTDVLVPKRDAKFLDRGSHEGGELYWQYRFGGMNSEAADHTFFPRNRWQDIRSFLNYWVSLEL